MPVNVYKISDKYYGPKNIYKLNTWFLILGAILFLLAFIYFFKEYRKERKHEEECIKCKENQYCEIKYSEEEVSLWTLIGAFMFLVYFIYLIYTELDPSSEYKFNRRYVYYKTR